MAWLRGYRGLRGMACLGMLVPGWIAAQAPAVRSEPMRIWPSQPPHGIPFAASTRVTGLAFTGRHAQYSNADTWYPSWAADGAMYSPFTDGEANGVISSSYKRAEATTGYATIVGDDPTKLRFTNVGTVAASAAPYGGRYPAGSLAYKGV